MSVIGFDVGNASCVIAAAKRGGIDVLLNDEAKRETPSVVSFGDKQRFLGSAGAAFATSNPKSTISQIKRLIGRLYNEPSVQEDLELLPFVTSEGPRGSILVELEYLNKKWTFSPVEILGMLFTHLKQVAEKNLESPVVDCVIGIPSYFTDLQRREYLDAAHIAGLRPLRLMHDGTATALGYGMYKTDLSTPGPTVVVFVDIGHCDTQVTVAAFQPGEMKILSHSFDPNLGGRDFDEALFRHFAAEFKEKYKIDVYSNARASIRLRASCEKVKKVLSANAEAPISIECLIGDTDVRGVIKREVFEKLSQELLERINVPCMKAVEDSGISVDKIYTIELVGSGSRIPAITKRLTLLFNKEPTRTLNASECVARGCALRCAMLSPAVQVRNYQVDDIFPYSIAVPLDEVKNDLHQELLLFLKGSPIPSDKMTIHNGSNTFYFQVLYTNKMDFPAGVSPKVGLFGIGFPEDSGAEIRKVEINMRLNDNGIVEIVSASILEDKFSAPRNLGSLLGMIVGNSQPLNLAFSENYHVATTKEELHEAQEREQMLAEQDKKVEENKDRRNTLESFVYDTRSKLSNAYRSFATESEKKVITDSLQETEDWLYEDSDDESEQDYTGKLDDLKKLLDPIENRYKYETARVQATKALQTCIAKYRSFADSLPLSQKQQFNDECIEVQQYVNNNPPENGDQWPSFIKNILDIFERSQATKALQTRIAEYRSIADSLPLSQKQQINDLCIKVQQHVNNSPPKNGDQWSSFIKNTLDEFERWFKHILSSKPSYPRHDTRVNPNQRDKFVDPNQKEKRGHLNQREKRVEPNQKDHHADPNQRDELVDPNQRNELVDPNQREKCMNPDQRDKRMHSNQRDKLVDPNQREKRPDPNHRDNRMDSNQRDKLVAPNQREKRLDPNHRDNHMDSNQRDNIVNPNQRDKRVDQQQRNKLVDPNQRDNSADRNQREKRAEPSQRDKSEPKRETCGPEPKRETRAPEPKRETRAPEPKRETRGCEPKGSTPVNPDQKDQPGDPNQRDQHQMDKTGQLGSKGLKSL